MSHARLAFLALALCGSAHPQKAFQLDISGPWRLSQDDRPAYAQTAFDDHLWPTVELPWPDPPPRGIYWLRRLAELPEGTDASQAELTLGAIAEAYEVYINGVPAGKAADSQIVRRRSRASARFPCRPKRREPAASW